jgi:hypothetical protein
LPERFLLCDATFDAIIESLDTSPNGLLLLDGDLLAWLSRQENRGSNSMHLHAMWSGTMLIKGRTRKPVYIERPCLSMSGGVRRATLQQLFRQNCQDRQVIRVGHDGNIGLIASLLLAMPPTEPIQRASGTGASPTTKTRLAELFDKLWSLDAGRDALGRIVPNELVLSDEAQWEWLQFHNRIDVEQAELTGYLAAAWSFLPSYVLRLSMVVHLCRWAEGQPVDPVVIDAESLRAAVKLVEWFGCEARRICAALTISESGDPTTRILDLIRRRGGRITARELQQHVWRFRNDGAGAKEELARLAEFGVGRWEPRRRTEEFVLNDAATVYGNPAKPDENRDSVDVDTDGSGDEKRDPNP